MRCNESGLEIIRTFEGLRLKAYRCPAGVLTIGYGHTGNVYEGQECTREDAEQWLREDAAIAAQGVKSLFSAPLTSDQFSALCSFVFNVGSHILQKSTIRKKINSLQYLSAADEFPRWNKSRGKVLPGLIARREAERALFLRGTDA